MVQTHQVKLSDYYVKKNGNTITTNNNTVTAANKNVVTNNSGNITFEDKPDIPTNTSDLTNDGSDGTNPFLTQHQDISGKANISDLGDVAFSNNYTDLDNKPSQNVFYGTCTTSASTQTKVITCTGWSFDTGNILFVFFSNGNTYSGTTKISIKNTSKQIYSVGTELDSRYYWKSGEVVGFIYTGNEFIMLEGGTATTSYYGVTKLTDSTSSTSTTTSATPNAVKTAYDLANGKADAVHTHTVSDITNLPSIPSITQTITDGDTTNVPSADAVYDALALKFNTADFATQLESVIDSLINEANQS